MMNFTEAVDMFEKAISFSIKAHHGQKRKGDGRPYILHPLTVMTTFYDLKKSSNALLLGTTAILHDVVEDCNVSIEKIAKEFGPQVASIVDELTSDKEKIEHLGKTEYLKQKMTKMSSYALAIKLCDRYDNVKDLSFMLTIDAYRVVSDTNEILKHVESHRKLTETHKKLIVLIRQRMQTHMDFSKGFRIGDRVVVLGNDEKYGTFEGKFEDSFVVKLENPYVIPCEDAGNQIISVIVVNRDNIFRT